MTPIIKVTNLSKQYVVNQQQAGAAAALKGLISRQKTKIHAVDGITFSIEPGEIVGFLGPNGAGKTTTLKMLSGLVYPTSGEIKVLNFVPYKRDKEFLKQITLVMGQRNQLVWDVPAELTFELNRAIYQIPREDYRSMVGELTDLLELSPLLNKPVRNLSLGERMKCEIAAALLHRPGMVFLDEPTIGLDVTMQQRIRSFFREYNRRFGATILLTSHYMADVAAMCKRVLVIHRGKLLFDGDLARLVQRFTSHKTIVIQLDNCGADLSRYGDVSNCEDGRYKIRVPKAQTAHMTERLLTELPVVDLLVEELPIEEVISLVFAQEPSNESSSSTVRPAI